MVARTGIRRKINYNEMNNFDNMKETVEAINNSTLGRHANAYYHSVLYCDDDLVINGDFIINNKHAPDEKSWSLKSLEWLRMMGIKTGVFLTDIDSSGVLYQSGMRVGDIILSVNGKECNNYKSFDNMLKKIKVDKIPEFEYLHGLEVIKITPIPVEDDYGDIDWGLGGHCAGPNTKEKRDILGIVVNGNLTVDGRIISYNLDRAGINFLYVAGDLTVEEILAENALIKIAGKTHILPQKHDRPLQTHMLRAVMEKDVAGVRDRLTREIATGFLKDDGRTQLHYAAASGNIEILEMMLEKGWDIDAASNREYDYQPPIVYAINFKKPKVVRFLLEKGALPNHRETWRGDDRDTPLAVAAAIGDVESTKLLIEYGAKVNKIIGSIGYTALKRAVQRNQLETARILLEKGANPNGANRPKDKTVTYYTVPLDSARSGEMVDLLVEYGAEVNGVNSSRETALHNIADSGDEYAPIVVEALLKHGADPRFYDKDGNTPLISAKMAGSVHAIAIAMKKGDSHNIAAIKNERVRQLQGDISEIVYDEKWPRTDIEIATEAMFQRARLAYEKQALEALCALIDEYPEAMKLYSTDSFGENYPFGELLQQLPYINKEKEFVGYKTRLDALRKAMETGVDVNCPVSYKQGTAMHALLHYSSYTTPEYYDFLKKAVQMLKDAGADITLKDKNGATPADLATNEIVRSIILSGTLPDVGEVLTERGDALLLDGMFIECNKMLDKGNWQGMQDTLAKIKQILEKLPDIDFLYQWSIYYDYARYSAYESGQKELAYDICYKASGHLSSFQDWPYLSEYNSVRNARRAAYNMLAWHYAVDAEGDIDNIEKAIENIDDCFKISSPIEKNPHDLFYDTRVVVYACASRIEPKYRADYEKYVVELVKRGAKSIDDLPKECTFVLDDINTIIKNGNLN